MNARYLSINKRTFGNYDWQLLGITLLVCCVGLTVLYSAGFYPDQGRSPSMYRQATAMGLGLVLFIICSLIPPAFWRRWSYVIYVLCCITVAGVLVTGVVAGGARRWLDFGAVRLQPSEPMKIGIILALARLFSSEDSPRDGYTIVKLILPFSLLALPMGLVLAQPDLGTGLVFAMITGSMLLLAGIHSKTIVKLIVAFFLALYPFWITLKEYQKKRILNFLDPELDPLGSGYHAIQSKIAVGSGMMTGKGVLQGTQTQLRFLPEQTTDFLFSVLAEEWGFIGSVIALLLYSLLIFRLLRIASRCSERFTAFVVVGVAAMIFWHVLMNMGMVVGILPVVGITLPLLSYGGSSVVTIMAALGIVAGISLRRFKFS